MIASITIYVNFKSEDSLPSSEALEALEDLIVPELRSLKERLEAKNVQVTFTSTQGIIY